VKYKIPADKVGILSEALKVKKDVKTKLMIAEVKVKSYTILTDGTQIIEVEKPIEELKEYELK